MRSTVRTAFTLPLAVASAAAFGQLTATPVVTGLTLPTGYYVNPANSNIAYITQKAGQVVQVQNGVSSTVLDISGITDSSGERGLLGMAFAPGFGTTNNSVYLSYVDPASKALRVVRTNGLSSTGMETIIDVPHPVDASNHYGGTIRFGGDGKLYVSMGDGGGANDPENDAQNLDNWLGKILRIDVSGTGPGYVAPADNPFSGSPTRQAIWSYGLRNPYKFSFDTNGDLYIGDVGQGAREEIDRIGQAEGGVNFGWPGREGTVLGPTGTVVGAREPIFDYGRSVGGSITGGVVYRGSALGAANVGRYFFGDYVGKKFYSINPNGGNAQVPLDYTSLFSGTLNVVSVDAGPGGLFVTDIGTTAGTGRIFQVQAVPEPASMVALLGGVALFVRRRKRG